MGQWGRFPLYHYTYVHSRDLCQRRVTPEVEIKFLFVCRQWVLMVRSFGMESYMYHSWILYSYLYGFICKGNTIYSMSAINYYLRNLVLSLN